LRRRNYPLMWKNSASYLEHVSKLDQFAELFSIEQSNYFQWWICLATLFIWRLIFDCRETANWSCITNCEIDNFSNIPIEISRPKKWEQSSIMVMHMEVNAKYLSRKQMTSFAKKEGFFSQSSANLRKNQFLIQLTQSSFGSIITAILVVILCKLP
jgi:hypothetical protein